MGKPGSNNRRRNDSPRNFSRRASPRGDRSPASFSPARASHQRRSSPASDAVEEAMYRKSRGQILVGIQSAISVMEFVCTAEVREYVKLQEEVRAKVGCSKNPGPDVKRQFSHLIRQRDEAGTRARKSLGSVVSQVSGEKGSCVTSALQRLVNLIRGELRLKKMPVKDDALVKFYSASVLRHDTEKSPEDVFDVFFAMKTCLTILENAPKKDLLDNKARDLKNLMGGLAHIIMVRVPTQKALEALGTEAISAFQRFEKADDLWAKGALRTDAEACQKKIITYTEALADAKDKRDIATLELKLNTLKKNAVIKKDEKKDNSDMDAAVHKAAIKLYAEQKTFFSIESQKWVLQRNYIPEIYNDLYPSFTRNLHVLLQAIDSTNPDYRSVKRLITDRRLAEYDDVTYKLPAVLSAKYQKQWCFLKRYSMALRQDIKALCKELAMQNTLETYVTGRVSAIFGDNSNIYLHFDEWHGDIYKVIEASDFNNSVHKPILLIWHMVYLVAKCHQAGVILGDIRPSSFVIDSNFLPHIHAFQHARITSQTEGVRESVINHEGGEFQPRELRGHEDRWGKLADMFALGKTIAVVADAARESLSFVGANKEMNAMIDGMTNDVAERRWNATFALHKCTEFLNKLKREFDNIQSQKEGLKDLQQILVKTREDLDFAAVLAEEDLLEVAHKKEEIVYQEHYIEAQAEKMSHYANAMKSQTRLELGQRIPDYWNGKSDKLFEFYPIPKSSHLFDVFRHVLETDDPSSLNCGRDVREKGNYSSLHLHIVWRIENLTLWRNYAVERHNIREVLHRRDIHVRNFFLRENLYKYTQKLPGGDALYKDCNETFLLHGTSPEPLLSICTNGVNERFTSLALFGKGTYFAEDPAKTDQYVQGDSVLGGYPALHQRLFPLHSNVKFPTYPYKAYYIFLCRVVMGFYVRVKCTNAETEDMYNMDFRGAKIFASGDRRELADIPGITNPPLPYHSLVAEKGGALRRFREFCQFHSNRVYPEYLICYTRK